MYVVVMDNPIIYTVQIKYSLWRVPRVRLLQRHRVNEEDDGINEIEREAVIHGVDKQGADSSATW